MNLKSATIILVTTLLSGTCYAQTQTAALEDFKPSILNQPGKHRQEIIYFGRSGKTGCENCIKAVVGCYLTSVLSNKPDLFVCKMAYPAIHRLMQFNKCHCRY